MATAVYRNSGTNRPFWLDLWQTESKYVAPDGRELGRVQAGEMTWNSYLGLDHHIATNRQDLATAKRIVETNVHLQGKAVQGGVGKSKSDHVD